MDRIVPLLQSTLTGVLLAFFNLLGLTVQLTIQGITALGSLFVNQEPVRETYGEIFFDDLYDSDVYEPTRYNHSPELEEPLRTLRYSAPKEVLHHHEPIKDYPI